MTENTLTQMRNAGLGLVLCALSACGGGSEASGDGGPDTGAADAVPPDAFLFDAIDPADGCGVLFLNFEPTDLTPGPDYPSINRSSIIITPVRAPGFRVDDPGRDAAIQAITSHLRSTLPRFGVSVVTTRPTDINYTMVIVGGTATTYGFPPDTEGSTQYGGCGTVLPRRVIFATDGPVVSRIANTVTTLYLLGLGLPQSSDPGDCLCFSGLVCDLEACTIGGPETPRLDGQEASCQGDPTFDAPMLITDALLSCR
jgi:hypothetical protein